jgi:hypothetical protein
VHAAKDGDSTPLNDSIPQSNIRCTSDRGTEVGWIVQVERIEVVDKG